MASVRIARPVIFCAAFLGATLALMRLDLSAHQPGTPARSQPAPDAGKPDPLGVLDFMCGSWRAQIGNDVGEEHWSEPVGGHMVGMFRWLEDGVHPRVLEIETISLVELKDEQTTTGHATPDAGPAPVLTFRHLAPADLAPMEDAAYRLRLDSLDTDAKRVVWRNTDAANPLATITYHRTSDDAMSATVAFTPESGREPITLEFERIAPRAR